MFNDDEQNMKSLNESDYSSQWVEIGALEFTTNRAHREKGGYVTNALVSAIEKDIPLGKLGTAVTSHVKESGAPFNVDVKTTLDKRYEEWQPAVTEEPSRVSRGLDLLAGTKVRGTKGSRKGQEGVYEGQNEYGSQAKVRWADGKAELVGFDSIENAEPIVDDLNWISEAPVTMKEAARTLGVTLVEEAKEEQSDVVDEAAVAKNPENYNIVVSGAGSEQLNGTYEPNGTFKGLPQWKSRRGGQIYWPSDGCWSIGGSYDSPKMEKSAATVPPTSGWTVRSGPAHYTSPAPSLRYVKR